MKIVVWSGIPLFAHSGCRIHYLLPAALGELGHEVYYCCQDGKDDSFPPDLQSKILPYLKHIYPKDFHDCLPADVLLYVDTIPETITLKKPPETPPSWNEVRKKVDAFVYMSLDYWEGWAKTCMGLQFNKSAIQAKESEIVSASTHVTGVSPQLCRYLAAKYRRAVYWLPNAAPPFFRPVGGSSKERDKVALIIGTPWYRDWVGIKQLAKQHIDWDFFWVGGLHSFWVLGTSPAGNCFFLYNRNPDRVMQLASISLVGIIPQTRTWFNYFGDPSKWYIYHACGLPIVVSYPIHYTEYPNFYLNTYADIDLGAAFNRFLADLPNIKYPLPFSDKHTYRHRAQALLDILDGKNPYGVVTADNADFVKGEHI